MGEVGRSRGSGLWQSDVVGAFTLVARHVAPSRPVKLVRRLRAHARLRRPAHLVAARSQHGSPTWQWLAVPWEFEDESYKHVGRFYLRASLALRSFSKGIDRAFGFQSACLPYSKEAAVHWAVLGNVNDRVFHSSPHERSGLWILI